MNPLFRSRWISLLVVGFLLISGRLVNADPVGDFLKKLGQSISKPFQPQPAQHQQTKKIRSARRPASRISSGAEASPTPTPIEQPSSKPAKEEKTTPTVLPASVAPVAKAKGDMPYGIPVPGRKGMVTSPYLPEGNYIDVSDFAPGSAVRDPYTGKIFRVP
jgi:hypothetical protein